MSIENENMNAAVVERRSRRIPAAIVYIILAAAACWYFRAHREEFKKMLSLRISHLAMLIGLNLVFRVLIGIRLKLLTRPFGVELGLGEGTGLSLMQGYGNAVAIKSGTVAVALYLNKYRSLSIDRFLAITGGGFVIAVITSSMAGLLGYGVLAIRGNAAGPEIPLMFCAALAGGLSMLLAPGFNVKAGRLGNFLLKVIGGWNVLKSHRVNLIKLILVELCVMTSFAARYWVAFRAFGQPIDFSQAFLLGPPAYLSVMANVTPVGVGIREPLLAYMAGILGHDVGGGLGAAVLDSIVFVMTSLIGGPIAATILWGRTNKKKD